MMAETSRGLGEEETSGRWVNTETVFSPRKSPISKHRKTGARGEGAIISRVISDHSDLLCFTDQSFLKKSVRLISYVLYFDHFQKSIRRIYYVLSRCLGGG